MTGVHAAWRCGFYRVIARTARRCGFYRVIARTVRRCDFYRVIARVVAESRDSGLRVFYGPLDAATARSMTGVAA